MLDSLGATGVDRVTADADLSKFITFKAAFCSLLSVTQLWLTAEDVQRYPDNKLDATQQNEIFIGISKLKYHLFHRRLVTVPLMRENTTARTISWSRLVGFV